MRSKIGPSTDVFILYYLKYLRIWVFIWINNVLVVLDKYFICGYDLFNTNVKNPHFIRSRKWVEFWQMLLLIISVWFCTLKRHLPSLKRVVQTCIYYCHITRLNAYISNVMFLVNLVENRSQGIYIYKKKTFHQTIFVSAN